MKINFSKIGTKDLATLAERVLTSTKKSEYKIIENHSLLNKIQEEFAQYQKVYNKLAYSGKGASVLDADKNRDKIFSIMRNYLKGFEKATELVGHQDALDLYQIFKSIGLKLDKRNYAEETALMNNLITELSKEENNTKLNRINLTPYFLKLKQAQADFEKIYAEQINANAELHKLPSATNSRKNLEQVLKKFFQLLDAMQSEAQWDKLYSEVNEIIKGIQK